MTDHISSFSPTFSDKNIVSFPMNAELPTSVVPDMITDSSPDGMPSGFFLDDDGIYHLRPEEGEDLIPVRICSPLMVKGICRKPNLALETR
ncbi:hypothetical protein [Pseudophaeobacter flagellatus]|uniref:hypothetical protein n=1 Tax=Pseudophaeobacter flagellatus TaxID=2899119 RepID=UPI001E372D75|nr:hypothetical protein [Pseudophaeobacter flagellatus]MCD9148836.1 hypothetical protein [Pseudophaeobacter flagellatus]